jgi:hypothetical protein
MPVLKDFRRTKEIELPSFPGSKVEIYDSILMREMMDVESPDLSADSSKVQIAFAKLPLFIKSWNFTDEEEKPLEITTENLSFLRMDDATFLLQQIQEFSSETKKKSES